MAEYIRDTTYEAQDRDCDFVMAVCDTCGKHEPPKECKLCMSDAYKKCPKIVAAYKKQAEENQW
jgi:hypothetical protein